MNLTREEITSYDKELQQISHEKVDLVICPSMSYLSLLEPKNYALGSQNVARAEEGSYTGEVSAKQLKSLGVSYCLVGHSERRQHQREQNEEINEKLKRLLEVDITPILCIGEREEEKENQQTDFVLKEQLEQALQGFTKDQVKKIIIAYEPVWAIGSGKVPTPKEVEQIFISLQAFFSHNYQTKPFLLYGGSVSLENYKNFQQVFGIDGLLIGGLSLKMDKLKQLLEQQ